MNRTKEQSLWVAQVTHVDNHPVEQSEVESLFPGSYLEFDCTVNADQPEGPTFVYAYMLAIELPDNTNYAEIRCGDLLFEIEGP